MKSIYEMKGVERAAALLVALGPSVAGDILKHLDDDVIEKLSVEIAKIERLIPEDKEELLGEFLIDLKKNKGAVFGGKDRAENFLKEAFGKEKAEKIFEKFNLVDIKKEFNFFNDIDSEVLFLLIKDEYPQLISVILSNLNPQVSAKIISLFDKDVAKEIAIRMAKMNSVSPEAVQGIVVSLKKKYREYQKNEGRFDKTAGIDSLVSILGHLTGAEERKLMDSLDISMPEISEQIKGRIFTFENIVTLTNNEIRILIDDINDDMVIARALKGAGDDIRFKIVRNLSQNRATDLINSMDIMGPIKLSEVQQNRDIIVSVMRKLNDNGEISLKKDGEIYVE